MVGNHNGQSHAFDNHHSGGGRQTADKGCEHHEEIAPQQWEFQNRHIAIGACGQNQIGGEGQRHHKQIDRHQIKRKQFDGEIEIFFLAVFDHGDMELAGQHKDRETR